MQLQPVAVCSCRLSPYRIRSMRHTSMFGTPFSCQRMPRRRPGRQTKRLDIPDGSSPPSHAPRYYDATIVLLILYLYLYGTYSYKYMGRNSAESRDISAFRGAMLQDQRDIGSKDRIVLWSSHSDLNYFVLASLFDPPMAPLRVALADQQP
jgi:hypothetical protein